MPEAIHQTRLLASMHAGYAAFEALLAPLSEAQMTIPGVNGVWSIKDNIAHISIWQQRLLDVLQAVKDGHPLPHIASNQTDDEKNEQIYQENKSRKLTEVQAELRFGYQQLVDLVSTTFDEELNKPIDQLNGSTMWSEVAGSTYEHYQDHGRIIESWLTSNGHALEEEHKA